MKALVLCGGIPQIALLEDLKKRGISTVLADMNEKVPGRNHADVFYPVSVFDIPAIRDIAIQEKVDFVITVCADQVLQVVAQISEELGLPCYIDSKTAENVSKKSYMKQAFLANGVPTSQYAVMAQLEPELIKNMRWPLIVKPVDSYGSRGVRKVTTQQELETAFADAIAISRTDTAIVEEFVEGNELTVDVYVEEGQAQILAISNLDKIAGEDRFVIYRTRYPAQISEEIAGQIQKAATDIAAAFGIENAPMLIQLITDGKRISIIEFCVRTGGGDKFRLIEKVSGFDVIGAVVDLTLGKKPHVLPYTGPQKYIVNEFLYCREGVFDHLEGFDELVSQGVLTEYFCLKAKGAQFDQIKSSGDRAAFFTIETEDPQTLRPRHEQANAALRVVGEDGTDLLRHDLIATY